MSKKEKKLKVLGLHTYLGGFLIGLKQAGLDIIASGESWNIGRIGAIELKLPSVDLEEIYNENFNADIVVSNPPCSRFSNLSFSFFKNKRNAYNKLTSFPELLDIIKIAKKTNAKIVWWETGPLAWSRGFDLINKIHDKLGQYWGKITTLIVRLDLRYIGIPQRRPRVHIIHVNTSNKPPNAPDIYWPIDKSLYDWIREFTSSSSLEVKPNKKIEFPIPWAERQQIKMTFRSMIPKIYDRNDRYSCSIVSRRLMLWQEEDKFWDLFDYATLMTYPLLDIPNLLEVRKTPLDAQVLLAKSVAPQASLWLYNSILKPWLGNDPQEFYSVKPTSKRENFYRLDLTVPFKLDKRMREGQYLIGDN